MTGQPLAPLQPLVAQALADGEVSATHAAVIARALDRLPVHLPDAAFAVAERFLVEAGRHQHPGAVATSAALLLARLDPDGNAPREDELQRRREFTLHRNADGSSRASGVLTPEATTAWQTILDALAAPAPSDGGVPDDRTAGQRRHDGLLDAGLRLLSSASLPAAGGAPVTVLVTTTADDLYRRDGVARTTYGAVWPTSGLGRLACAADFVPMLFDGAGGALSVGRTRRLATRAQRLALVARDGGCCFPGCDRPAAWTEVHHVEPWQEGGATDVDNLCLLCRFHHREFERRGWQVRMRDGVPEWIPPPFIDADRRPVRNHAHHPPDYAFASLREAS